ncbi:unnamed protein product, partial [Ectocarpus fasciculatus]
MSVVREDKGETRVGNWSTPEVEETPQRRRATRSGVVPVVVDVLMDPAGAPHRHTRSMSTSLEAVGRAVHFSGLGKEVTDAVANARQLAANRERMGGAEGPRSAKLSMNEFGMLAEVITEVGGQEGSFDIATGGAG